MRQFRLKCFQKIHLETVGTVNNRREEKEKQVGKPANGVGERKERQRIALPERGNFLSSNLLVYATLNGEFIKDNYRQDLFDAVPDGDDFRRFINEVRDYFGHDDAKQDIFSDKTYDFNASFCGYCDIDQFCASLERPDIDSIRHALDLYGTGFATDDIRSLHAAQGDHFKWRRWLQKKRAEYRNKLLMCLVPILQDHVARLSQQASPLLEQCLHLQIFQQDALLLEEDEAQSQDLCQKGLACWQTLVIETVQAYLGEGGYDEAAKLIEGHLVPPTYGRSDQDIHTSAAQWQRTLRLCWHRTFTKLIAAAHDTPEQALVLLERSLSLPASLALIGDTKDKEWKTEREKQWHDTAQTISQSYRAQQRLEEAVRVLARAPNLNAQDHKELMLLSADLKQPKAVYQHYIRGLEKVKGKSEGERRELKALFARLGQTLNLTLENRSQVTIDLLNTVSTMWIKGKLEHHLNQREELPIEWLPPPQKEPPLSALYEMFEVRKRLFIAGEAGTGKTILMLRLLNHLIERAWVEDNAPLPLVIPLNSWVSKKREASADAFKEWLLAEMRRIYNLSQTIAVSLLNAGFILLADGLDEFIYDDDPISCALALRLFLIENKQMGCVVCCRTETLHKLQAAKIEFETCFSNKELVDVQPLKPHIVEQLLQNEEFKALRKTYDESPALQDLLRIPLYLNMARFTYRGRGQEFVDQLLSHETMKTHLSDIYFEERVLQYNAAHHTPFSYPDTIRYISWLANHLSHARFEITLYRPFQAWMRKRFEALANLLGMKGESDLYNRYLTIHGTDITLFYIEDLQPQWLSDDQLSLYVERINRLSMLIFGALWGACGFVAGTILCLIIWQRSDWLPLSLGFGLITWLTIALAWRFSGGAKAEMRIEPVEILIWNKARALDHWRKTLSVAAVAFLVPIVLGLPLTGLWAGAIVTAFFVLMTGLQPREMRQTVAPNQKMFDTARNFLFVLGFQILFLVAMFGLILITVQSLDGDFLGGLTIVLFFAFALLSGVTLGNNTKFMRNGSLCLMQHLLLRYMLTSSGHTPGNYRLLLDYAANVRILDPIGGGYQFVHRDILGHFADQFRGTVSETPAG